MMPPLLALLKGRRTGLFFAALALIFAAWRFVEFRLQILADLMPMGNFLERTDIRCDGLLWGVAMAAAYLQPDWRGWLNAVTRPALVPLWLTALVAAIVWEPPLRHMWIAFLPSLLIVSTVLHPSSWLSRCLEHPLLRYIGHRSYSIYLWQSLFLVGPEVARPLPLGWIQSFPLGLVLVWLTSEASFRLIEKPMIRLGHRLTSGSAANNHEPASTR
jgi:peptidoglycan/LPS O-acetylase OafA/YrhL